MRTRFIITTVCALVGWVMAANQKVNAQGIERESLSGPSAASEMRQSGDDAKYNLKLGPVTLRVEADLPVSYNDNINLVKTGRVSDFITTPTLELIGQWQISDLNTLKLDLGIGYEAYFSHPRYNDLILSPDSEASFNFFIGDIAFDAHDSFSYQQDPTQIGQLSNTTRLSRFNNDIGIGATWDLNAFILTLDYDHANLWVTQSAYSYLTNQSDSVAPKVTYDVNQSIKAGIEASYSNVRYDEHFENNYMTESVGPFANAQISDNLSVQGRAGGYFSEYARGGRNGDSEDVSSYYASAGVNHRLNDAISENLTVGHEFIPGLTSNFTERIYANYGNTWKATQTINVGTNLWWENLNDSDSSFRENSNRYGAGINADANLSEHATLSVDYQYILKDANPSALSYYQNVVTVGARYRF